MIQQFRFWVYTQKNWNKVLKRYLYVHIDYSIIPNCQNVEMTEVFIARWMCKQSGIYACDGVLFSLEKEEHSDTFLPFFIPSFLPSFLPSFFLSF